MSVLFSFDHSWIASKVSASPEDGFQIGLGFDQGSGYAQEHGASLSGGPTATNVGPDVKTTLGFSGDQGGVDGFSVLLLGEIGVDVPPVDLDISRSGANTNASHGGFSATQSPNIVFGLFGLGFRGGGGGLFGFVSQDYSPYSFLELQLQSGSVELEGFGFLSCMRMFGSGINLQLA